MNRKKICVVTSGRWDYSHLYWVMKDIAASDKLELTVVYPASHHNKDSIHEISRFSSDIEICGINGITEYSVFYDEMTLAYMQCKPDIVLLLGDRFEIHAAATAACLLNIPIAHIHGGEKTAGAFDDALRNSITQMATWHFTANKKYSENVARMTTRTEFYNNAEDTICIERIGGHGFTEQNRTEWDNYSAIFSNGKRQKFNVMDNISIFNVGAPGLDWLTRAKLKTREELQQELSIDLSKPFVLACFHPVTKELTATEKQVYNFGAAVGTLAGMTGWNIILIEPNIDPNSGVVIKALSELRQCGMYLYNNFDHLTYLSLLQYAEIMVGNSSSGIIESASFNLPAVNIGTRQEGRIKPPNVIGCGYGTEDILAAIEKAKRYNTDSSVDNPYGDGQSSKRIVEILENLEV